MDLEMGPLLTSMLVSSVGLVLFMYGRRMKRVPQIVVGLVLVVFPYFVSSVWLMLVIGAVLVGGLWALLRMGF